MPKTPPGPTCASGKTNQDGISDEGESPMAEAGIASITVGKPNTSLSRQRQRPATWHHTYDAQRNR
jgi:hypothetical protein